MFVSPKPKAHVREMKSIAIRLLSVLNVTRESALLWTMLNHFAARPTTVILKLAHVVNATKKLRIAVQDSIAMTILIALPMNAQDLTLVTALD